MINNDSYDQPTPARVITATTTEKSPIQSSELLETPQENSHDSDMESPDESSSMDTSTGFKKVSADEVEKGLKQRHKKIQDLFSDKGTVS